MSHLPVSIIEAFSQMLYERYAERITKSYMEHLGVIPIATMELYLYKRFTPPEQIMKDTLAEIINPYKTVIILKGI